jgi:NAD(P)-dependent dehydrogenase (short-subunit alcohol dehydrogenase family)
MVNITDAKCVLVIGATAGIGAALAVAIHALPSKPTVIISGRRQERIDELCKKGERIKGIKVDITSGKDALEAFVNETIDRYPEVCSPCIPISCEPFFTQSGNSWTLLSLLLAFNIGSTSVNPKKLI